MTPERNQDRLTLGRMMRLIAVLALMLAWYAYDSREFARIQAWAEAERARADAEAKRAIAANEEQAAKEEEMERKNDEAMAKAQEALERAKQPQPQPPPISSIPGQVRNIVRLLEDRRELEEKSQRFHVEVAEKIRERMEKQRLESEASKAPTPPAAPAEPPR